MQRLRGDEGATAVLVAVLMVAMLGVGAIVLDAGALYAERRQLQNGADAAALAVVLDCPGATGCDTGTGSGSVAGGYAAQNANDGAAAVQHVCGVGANLTPCSPVSGLGPWDCRPLPGALSAANYVQVRTQTRATDGADLVPPLLARFLNPGYTGTTGRACARASWGAPASLTSGLAITISYCEWSAATSGGTSFAPAPPYPPNPPTSVERVLKLHSTVTGTCPGGGSGSDRPGSFGWLNDDNNNCTSNVDLATGEYGTDPGNNISQACKTAFNAALTAPYSIDYIPVYDSAVANGNNTTYTLRGFAAFVLTGAKLPGYNRASWLYPSNPARCTGSDHCLYGFFTEELLPVGGVIGTAPDMGVTVFQMSG